MKKEIPFLIFIYFYYHRHHLSCLLKGKGKQLSVRQCYNYMIVCINTSCACQHPLDCIWTLPKSSGVKWVCFCLPVGQTLCIENGSCRTVQAWRTTAPSAAVVIHNLFSSMAFSFCFRVDVWTRWYIKKSKGVASVSCSPMSFDTWLLVNDTLLTWLLWWINKPVSFL